MPQAKTRIWFVPTSPRSPYKLRNELELLSRFGDKNWWERNNKNQPINQLEFARLLKESTFFEGKISERVPDFSARDRCRAFWMFGFAYIDNDNTLHITPAGKKLIKGIHIEELFLKQLLKWQFPSWQHGGNPRTAWKYPVENMNIFPFVESIRVVQDVGGVSKKEIAMFLLPCLSREDFKQVPTKILAFREELRNIRGDRFRKEFIENYHFHIFEKVYEKDIKKGRINTRETPTINVTQFIKKKMRNSNDYADAVIRYFQYTGMFTRSWNKMVISSHRVDDVNRILSEMEFKLSNYTDVIEFYTIIGNPTLPFLPWENQRNLNEKIDNLNIEMKKIIINIQNLDPTYIPPTIPTRPLREVSPIILKDHLFKLEDVLKNLHYEQLSREIRKPEIVEDIIDMYQKILNNEVIGRSIFFEWNTWRAFLALDDSKIKPNFQMDKELMPICTAGGRQADIEIYFNDDYVVLIEVTLSGGARQYDTETEPVTRHIGEFQANEHRKVYGFFIAPAINPNTPNFFYVYLKHLEYPKAGYLTIVPLPLNKFTDFLSICMKKKIFNRNTFKNLLNKIEELKTVTENGAEWYEKILITFDKWIEEKQ